VHPRLRQAVSGLSPGRRLDLPRIVQKLSRAEILDHLPRLRLRRWGQRLVVVLDRSDRLVPFFADQEALCSQLQAITPPGTITTVYVSDPGDEFVYVDQAGDFARFEFDCPARIIVLSDLGWLQTGRNSELLERWQLWATRTSNQGNSVVALVPFPTSVVDASLRRCFELVAWQRSSHSFVLDTAQRSELVRKLLAAVSPVVRLEPGLLRAIRTCLATIEDASIESDFWQHPAIVGRHVDAGSLDRSEMENRYGAEFSKLPSAQRAKILAAIRSWRYEFSESPAVWFQEILSLDIESQEIIEELFPGDMDDAIKGIHHLAAEAKRPAKSRYLTLLREYGGRASGWLSKTAWSDERIRKAVHDLWAASPSRSFIGKEGFDSSLIESNDPPVNLHLAQCGTDLSFSDDKPSVGSLVARMWTRNRLTDAIPLHYAKYGFWKDGVAPIWAKDWGWDEFGPWAEFEVLGQDGQAVCQRLRWIPSGEFMMGSPIKEANRSSDEVLHSVTLSRGYWMFDTPVTQELWRAVVGTEPSHFQGARLPVEQVSWQDAQDFIGRLNECLGGEFMTLPTESQWEYACRAGTKTPYSFGSVCDGTQANCNGNYPYGTKKKGPSLAKTSPVGSYAANAWGLFDMHGNVWEWCHDWYGPYTTTNAVDRHGPSEGPYRVLRGGSWSSDAHYARSACRLDRGPGDRSYVIGFRCAQVQGAAEPTRADGGRRRRLHPTSGGAGARVLIQPHQTITTPLPEGTALRVESDVDVLELTRITKPEWASAMGRDRYGLWAEFTVEIPAIRKSKKGSKRVKSSASPPVPEVDFVTQRMRWIPPGRFLMGSTESDDQVIGSEKPVHDVTLNYGYWLFDTPVTQSLWHVIMPENPSHFKGSKRPVESVSWDDCQQFLNAINKHFAAKQIDLELVLPTEAEWEYACRAGTTTRYSFGDSISLHQANYLDSSSAESETSEVKKFASNPWGLYDMHGNVWEWCQDCYGEYTNDAIRNPLGPSQGRYRVLRGGSWLSSAGYARSACRYIIGPGDRYFYFGFRCAQVQKISRVSEQASERLATSGSEASK
jgi:formylglycine-generating enzyme required for sulfatase activity